MDTQDDYGSIDDDDTDNEPEDEHIGSGLGNRFDQVYCCKDSIYCLR